MIEVRGNLWDYPADVRVITTNGTIKKNGECVMGRGCAFEAKQRWPSLAKTLGLAISDGGNHVHALGILKGSVLYSFPVKHEWYQKADIALIERSARELLAFENELRTLNIDEGRGYTDKVIVMPRPGCGNGGLRWEDVKPVLEPILDDRFHVITF